MRAKQSSLPEQALLIHFVMLEVGLTRGRLSLRTAGRAVGWHLPGPPGRWDISSAPWLMKGFWAVPIIS